MIISKTPLRISLFGGGTDYPAYYENCPGAVLGATIDKYIYLSLNKLSPFFEHKIRISYSKNELISNVDDIEHPSIRECLKHHKLNEGLDIHIFADIPAKTGLGSSSSFTVGFLNALYAHNCKKVSKQQLATEATFIEQQLIKEKVGSQDQFHASFGGLNIMEFSKRGVDVKPLIISYDKLSLLEDSLMLFYTGINRFAEDILDEQIKNTKAGLKDEHLKKMHQMVYTAEEIISQYSGDELIQKLGDLMNQSWDLKKELSSKISNKHIDDLHSRAISSGAIAGKLCGAGHGGFLLLLAPKEKHQQIRSGLSDLLEVDFKFDHSGSSVIYYNH